MKLLDNNKLKTLPPLPESLYTLDVVQNAIETLPSLPLKLKYLKSD